MQKRFIVVLVLCFMLAFTNQLVQAERVYVNTAEAEAVLDLMDGIAKKEVKTKDDIIKHLEKIYNTEGYHRLCDYHGYNPHKNKIMNRIFRVSWSIIHEQTEELEGYDLYYLDIFKHRDEYRKFLERFKGWKPTEKVLNRTYSYFPEKKPFEGTIYFVVDEYSDGYTPVPNMVFSIYQVKKLLEDKGVDFAEELFPHEFHHILTKELLFEKYAHKLIDSSDLAYFLGYIMLEGYAVEATAFEDTKNNVYMMKRSDKEIYNLFARIEKVIQRKNENPEIHWRTVYREYFSKMIDIYTVGTTMVQAIEDKFGKKVLVRALENPSHFFMLYQKAAENNDMLFSFQESTMDIISEAFAGSN